MCVCVCVGWSTQCATQYLKMKTVTDYCRSNHHHYYIRQILLKYTASYLIELLIRGATHQVHHVRSHHLRLHPRRDGIRVCTSRTQQECDSAVAAPERLHQWTASRGIHGVQETRRGIGRKCVQQRFDAREPPSGCGAVQRRVPPLSQGSQNNGAQMAITFNEGISARNFERPPPQQFPRLEKDDNLSEPSLSTIISFLRDM